MRGMLGRLSRIGAIGFLVFTAGVGCVFDAGGLGVVGFRYDCTSAVKDCGLVAKPAPDVEVVLPVPTPPCYKRRFNLQVNKALYCDRNWVVSQFSSALENPAKGATWVWPRQEDADLPGVSATPSVAEFIKVHWPQQSTPVAAYVAYDSRATTKPSWLAQGYKPALDSQGKQFTLTLALPTPGGGVDLELFEKISPPVAPTATNPFVVPGNLNGNPSGWSAGDTKAMYVALFKSQPEVDLTNCTVATTPPVKRNECYSGQPQAEKEAAKACTEWLAKNGQPNQVCDPPVCTYLTTCPSEEIVASTTGLRIKPTSFPFHSLIEFGPKHSAKAKISADQTQTVRDVSGTLHFEYLLDAAGRMHEMRLNSMSLSFGSVPSDAGAFSNNVVSLLAPVTATCQGAFKPWATPCDSYHLAPSEFAASLSTHNNGKDKVFLAQNTGVMPIAIDHAKRTLRVLPGAKLTTELVDGDTKVTVEIDLDLTGGFLNFAPKAVAGGEWVSGVECGSRWTNPDDGRPTFVSGNKIPVVLDAGASFEIYGDPLPPTAFRWFEDRGLGSQLDLGAGDKVTLSPYQLSFGSHAMSLVVQDPHGAFGTDDFELWVVDTQPPSLSVPSTLYFLPSRPGPVRISPGQATAQDSCAKEVMISNDAPAGDLFPPGVLTKVTWSADDGHGNVTQKVQDVYVFEAVASGDPWTLATHAARALSLLESATVANQKALEGCLASSVCTAEPGALAAATEEIMAQLERAAENDGVDVARVQELLSAATGEFEAMAGTLSQVAELEHGRTELFSASLSAAATSTLLVSESREILTDMLEGKREQP